MSCHTTCYAHIPSEAEKWAEEYKKIFLKVVSEIDTSDFSEEQKTFIKEVSETIKTMSSKDIPKYLDEKQSDFKYWDLLIGCISLDDDYGCFNVHDGKIYREVVPYFGSNPEIAKTWPFDKSYHDMFRIYDYDAEPCCSLEETLERCKEYKKDWNERADYGSNLLINNKELVYEFWEKYPDGMIIFG